MLQLHAQWLFARIRYGTGPSVNGHVIASMVGNSENYYFKGMLLCSTESSASDHSKYIKLHPQTDLFTPTPNGLLWTHAAIIGSILSFHYTSEWTEASWREWKFSCFETSVNGIRTQAPSIGRVQRSIEKLPHSTKTEWASKHWIFNNNGMKTANNDATTKRLK